MTDAFKYLASGFTVAGLVCNTSIVSITAVPGYTLQSQIERMNDLSVALTAAEAAPIPKLTPAPMPAQYPVTSVAAGLELQEGATLELCASLCFAFSFLSCLCSICCGHIYETGSWSRTG